MLLEGDPGNTAGAKGIDGRLEPVAVHRDDVLRALGVDIAANVGDGAASPDPGLALWLDPAAGAVAGTGVLLEIVKDLLYEAYVRKGKLQQSGWLNQTCVCRDKKVVVPGRHSDADTGIRFEFRETLFQAAKESQLVWRVT